MNRLLASLCLLLLHTAPSAAQTANAPAATPPQADDSRLKQYETTYQTELKKLHIPLLSKYLLDLQRLNAQTIDPTQQAAITAEILRVQKIITAGGVVDLASAAKGTREPTPPGSMDKDASPKAKGSGRALLTLTPADATAIAPHFAGDTEAAAVAQISWMVDALPAGSYEVIAEYSFPNIAGDTPVKVTLAKEVIETKLTTMRATKDATQFRILRVGRLDLAEEIVHEALTLTVADGQTAPYPLLRQIIIARAKKEDRPTPPPAPPKKEVPVQ